MERLGSEKYPFGAYDDGFGYPCNARQYLGVIRYYTMERLAMAIEPLSDHEPVQ